MAESASLRDQANRLFVLHIPCIGVKVNDVHSPLSECYMDEEAQFQRQQWAACAAAGGEKAMRFLSPSSPSQTPSGVRPLHG